MNRFATTVLGAFATILVASPTLACSSCGCSAGNHSHGTDKKASTADKPSIVETAKQAGMFNTLLTAAKAAGLAETLAEGGPFTVLAPTDEAFANLPEGTLETLLKPESKETLKAILLYHVIDGEVMSDKVVGMDEAETLQGSMIDIKTSDEGVMINNAKVVKTDIVAGNGVIHVIDTVLIPTKTASAERDAKPAG